MQGFVLQVESSLIITAQAQINFVQGRTTAVPLSVSTLSANLTVNFTSDNLNNGRMHANVTDGATINLIGNTLMISGPTDAVNTCLQSLKFIPGPYFRGVVGFSCLARDGLNPDKAFNMQFQESVDVSHNPGAAALLSEVARQRERLVLSNQQAHATEVQAAGGAGAPHAIAAPIRVTLTEAEKLAQNKTAKNAANP
ncbi:MAG: hypothetical protein K0S29_1332 [Gammaproteobacteria bacterium]|jgi:hypothetical protein|nr:hypothetical protein [Gammaproteobacteria bacterium]